jgi:hypothetical protein
MRLALFGLGAALWAGQAGPTAAQAPFPVGAAPAPVLPGPNTAAYPAVFKLIPEATQPPTIIIPDSQPLPGGSHWNGDQTPIGEVAPEQADESGGEKKKEETCPNPWLKVPPIFPMPRTGDFPIPPSGPGYYSLWDCVQDKYREKPPQAPYGAVCIMPFSFFNADWRYLDDPKNTQHDYLDFLHRIHLGDNWMFDTGGQTDWRHMHEINSRLTGKNNDYDLWRLRAYGDLWYQDCFRVFVEFISAQTFNQDLPPLVIDRNYADLLNAFIDLKFCTICDAPAYVRVGRQELLFGSQRLISPLDWANTRRTFEGVDVFRHGEKFDVDAFWVSPVVPDPSRFDSVNDHRNFAGLWTTYRPRKGTALDAYYLVLDDTEPAPPPGVTKPQPPYTVHTLGSRYFGDYCHFLWDFEGMVQVGAREQQSILAGAYTVGGGYDFAKLPWNPTFWAYYDYASGDNHPDGTGGSFGTFNQLFPFGHYYFGFLDLVGRQNIEDFNLHLFLYPTKWITLWTQYHNFHLASATDALYSAGGVPERRDVTGKAGRDVGQEIDFFCNFHLSFHSDILVGYSHLYSGSFIQATSKTPAQARDPELFYVMYNFRW